MLGQLGDAPREAEVVLEHDFQAIVGDGFGEETHEDGRTSVLCIFGDCCEEFLIFFVLKRDPRVTDENYTRPAAEDIIQCVLDGEGFVDYGT